jgi:hypothetical protein
VVPAPAQGGRFLTAFMPSPSIVPQQVSHEQLLYISYKI